MPRSPEREALGSLGEVSVGMGQSSMEVERVAVAVNVTPETF